MRSHTADHRYRVEPRRRSTAWRSRSREQTRPPSSTRRTATTMGLSISFYGRKEKEMCEDSFEQTWTYKNVGLSKHLLSPLSNIEAILNFGPKFNNIN